MASVNRNKAWKRAAEMLKKRGFNAPDDWTFEQLNNKLKSLPKPVEPAAQVAAPITPTKAEVVLPSSQRLDVQAPQMIVHVPAPHVTINGGKFSLAAAWQWGQAYALGFSTAFILLSQLVAH